MAHHAHIGNWITADIGVVDRVIRIDYDVLVAGYDPTDMGNPPTRGWGNPADWFATSYNTSGGVHSEGGTPIAYNYAGVGYLYDKSVGLKGAFYAPSPFPSWVLNTEKYQFEASTPMPTDGQMYAWNESTLSWDVVAP